MQVPATLPATNAVMLATSGLTPRVSIAAATAAPNVIDPSAVIERVAQKKLAQLGNLDPLTLRRRLFAFLARRGYDLDEIKAVVGRLAR